MAKERRVTRARQLLNACGIDNCYGEDLDRQTGAAARDLESVTAEMLREKLGEVVGVTLTEEQTRELMAACRPGQADVPSLGFQDLSSVEFDATLDRFTREAQLAKQKANAEAAARNAELAAQRQARERGGRTEVVYTPGEVNDDRELPTRLLSVLAYLLPLLDGLQFGRPLVQFVPALMPIFAFLAVPNAVLDAIPFGQLIVFFAMSIASSNKELPRLLRLNLQQGIYLDIALFLPSITFQLFGLISGGGGKVPPEIGIGVFVLLVLAIAYSVVTTLLGQDPDGVPGISKMAKDRVDRDL